MSSKRAHFKLFFFEFFTCTQAEKRFLRISKGKIEGIQYAGLPILKNNNFLSVCFHVSFILIPKCVLSVEREFHWDEKQFHQLSRPLQHADDAGHPLGLDSMFINGQLSGRSLDNCSGCWLDHSTLFNYVNGLHSNDYLNSVRGGKRWVVCSFLCTLSGSSWAHIFLIFFPIKTNINFLLLIYSDIHL